ncbi:vitamin D3 hydroxylase-associated protein-like [Branchiostoma floridae]|uniref:Fatty-acid amide hydrolase 1 n=1 Tax=Branchiostoma floridae TaxID=7739 RepID=A0A9J7NDC9_BRAFL|nr:vitamin D3 hydroxylase-associated protein-like [Branchiostoma floridae]
MSDFVDFCWDVLEDSRLPLVVCTTLVGVLTVYVERKFYTRQQYKRKVQGKNEERQKALQDVLKSLDTDDKGLADKRKQILTLTLPRLTQQLQDGQLSAVQVLQAFQEKALAVHDGINCITEPVPNALARAQELDSTDQKSGLLYGVPVSIKDNINIKGMANTLGLVKYLENYAEEDSVIVRVLKKQGAVPFVKTNIPQTMFDIACSNPLFGTTLNPRDPTRSPGGSSGGEAALIGGGGSILGIGNDIAGSIRIPAHFCGICGFKPTANRLSKQGYFTCAPGLQGVVSTCGPMARDVDSLVLVMRALLVPDMFQLDPLVPPIPFRHEIYESKKPLKVGYFLDWELKMATPALTRAMKVTKEALEKAGHKLVQFQPPKSDHAFYDIVVKCMLADGGKTISNRISGEIANPRLKSQLPYLTMSYFWRKVVGFLLKPISPRIARGMSNRVLRTIYDLWQRLVEREEYIREFLAAWEEAGIDVLLCPAYPIPAFKYKGAPALSETVLYTNIFNLLNFPAGVVPVTKVTEEDDRLLDDYTGFDNDIFDRFVRKATKGAVGMPVAVQCVALPWQEEECHRLMKEVETVCKE